MKYFVALLLVVGFIGISYAVPELDPHHAFNYSDMVLVGNVLSVDILSEPKITRTENFSSEESGIAMYEIEVEKYFKTSTFDKMITVPGLFTREPNGMSHSTYPYEQNQRVLLYLQKNTHGYADTDLIIRLGDSQIVKDIICKDEGFQKENCIVNGRNISASLKNENKLELSSKFTDEDICGTGTVLVDGVCTIIDNGCKPDMYGNIYCDPPIEDRLTLERFLFEPPIIDGKQTIPMGLKILVSSIIFTCIFVAWRKRK